MVPVLDGRVYRTAFLPALLALFLAAFALQDRPTPGRSELPADSSAATAHSAPSATRTRLAAGARGRVPGPYARLGRRRRARGLRGRGPGRALVGGPAAHVHGRTDHHRERPADGDRDASWRCPGAGSSCSPTVTPPARRSSPPPLCCSNSAASSSRARAGQDARAGLDDRSPHGLRGHPRVGAQRGGRAGRRRDRARRHGEQRRSTSRGWCRGRARRARRRSALERTVQAAVRRETRSDPGGPRAAAQWVRRALPVTLSEQGAVGAEGLPAVLISASGELGPARRRARLSQTHPRLRPLGRARRRRVRRRRPGATRPRSTTRPSGIVTLRNVMTDWASGCSSARCCCPPCSPRSTRSSARAGAASRRALVGWLVVAAVPLPVAWLWLRVLGATGVSTRPPAPVRRAAVPPRPAGSSRSSRRDRRGALACFGARPWRARSARGRSAEEAPTRRSRARRARRRGPRGGDRDVAVRAGGARLGPQPLRGGSAESPPRTCGCSPPAAGAAWPAVAALAGGLLVPRARARAPRPRARTRPAASSPGARRSRGHDRLGRRHDAAVRRAAGRARRAWCACCSRAAGSGPRTAAPASSSRTRGPLSYAGPGSLGGTESALRR